MAQAVTVAYEPFDLTVMSWVESPGLTGTGKFGAAAAAPVDPLSVPVPVPVPPLPAVAREVPADDPEDLLEFAEQAGRGQVDL
ncbi:hypothetical protein ACWCQW_29375 [Streptomyces mirabilis]